MKSLNDKLILLYENLEKLDKEYQERITNSQNVAGFSLDSVSDIKTRQESILKEIGDIKSVADNNFLKFMQNKMTDSPKASVYSIIRQLLALKTSTNNQERIVVIDDIICVNESKTELAKSLLEDLRIIETDQLEGQISIDLDTGNIIGNDIVEEQVPEEPVDTLEITAEEIANNDLKSKIEKELIRIEGRTSKYTEPANNGKTIASAYLKEYNRLLDILKLLEFTPNETLESVLGIAYVPSDAKKSFEDIITRTDFYRVNYVYERQLETNNALISELETYLTITDDVLEQNTVKKAINLLGTKSKKLVNVWNIGFVPSKDIPLFKDLILNSKYLTAKVSKHPVNSQVLEETISSLNDLQRLALDNPNAVLVNNFIILPENLDEANALLTKYKVLKDAIDIRNTVKAADNTMIARKSLNDYENALDTLAAINDQKARINASFKHTLTHLPVDYFARSRVSFYDIFLNREERNAFFRELTKKFFNMRKASLELLQRKASSEVALVPVNTNNDLRKRALEAIKNAFLNQRARHTLIHEPITKVIPQVLDLPAEKPLLALPAPSKATLDSEKITKIVEDALQNNLNGDALSDAVNEILAITNRPPNPELEQILEEAKSYTVEEVSDFVPPKRYKEGSYKTDEELISEKITEIFNKNNAYSSEEAMQKSIDELLDAMTDGKHSELDKLLKEVRQLLGEEKVEVVQPVEEKEEEKRESQILIGNPAKKTTEAPKKEPILARIRKWGGKKFKNIKIFCDSIMAAGLAEENRLGTNPYVTRINSMIDLIKERASLAFSEYNGAYDFMPNLYHDRQLRTVKELPSVEKIAELASVSEYDATIIVEIMKSGILINNANAKIDQIKTFIQEQTQKRFRAEYNLIASLKTDIRVAESEIAKEQANPSEISDYVISKNRRKINSSERQIADVEELITERSNETYVAEYARIQDLQNSINSLREKVALAQAKLYKNFKENNNPERARFYRDSVMKATSLDLDGYSNLKFAKKDIQELMALDNEELVDQMKCVIENLEVMLPDTRKYSETVKISRDIEALRSTITEIDSSGVRLFR